METEAIKPASASKDPVRIVALRVENYRALRSVEFKNLTPLTVLLGPNGSGKSTVFDVFHFLSECFLYSVGTAWDRRGRAEGIKTRGQKGPVVIGLKYRENPKSNIITYHLAIDEDRSGAFVAEEWMQCHSKKRGKVVRFLDNTRGNVRTNKDGKSNFDVRYDPMFIQNTPLVAPDWPAVNILGQFALHARAAVLRDFITGWYVAALSMEKIRDYSETGPQEHLSQTGDNLPNVIQHLRERHPDRFEHILQTLRRRVPRLAGVSAEVAPNDRLLLQIKDAPFDRPVPSRYASDGTLKMLAYLVVLHDPDPPKFIGIEEPENFLHPRLLPELAGECREASGLSQLLVTTHSPFFLNAIRPDEVRVLYRDEQGFAQAVQASKIAGVNEFVQTGGLMGHLWTEGHLGVGDPLVDSGAPQCKGRGQ